MKKLSEADIRHLSICPQNKWFDETDVFPRIKRGRYSLGRLVEYGLLKIKYDGNNRMYKIIPQKPI